MAKVCSVEGCGRNSVCRGMCDKHYSRAVHEGVITTKKRGPNRVNPPSTCTVNGCDKPYVAKGYCRMHYTRLDRYGDAKYESEYAASGDHKIWLDAHAGHTGAECLKWPFKAKNMQGYGVTTHDGRQRNASNVMCRIAHGEPPTPEHEAAHSCGKGHEGCVNPKHLRWATRAENHADKVMHGTNLEGEANHMSKLTEKDVLEIRSSKSGAKEISERYGIGYAYVYQIRNGERWKHLV